MLATPVGSPEPVLFGKFANALIGPGEAIVLPPEATQIDSEAELAVEIGRRGRRLGEDDALDFVAGYRCANDVSARNLQFADEQWLRGKSFDTFCPLGDRLVLVSAWGDGSGLGIVQRWNGETLQDGNTANLIYGVRRLVAHAWSVFTLERGDLILTGTPAGVGYTRTPPVTMRDGDVVEVEIEGIGVLRNPVAGESRRAAPPSARPRPPPPPLLLA